MHRPGRRRGPRRIPIVRFSHHSDVAVAPGLSGNPVEGVIAVTGLIDKRIPLAFGAPLSPDILGDVGVPFPGPESTDSGQVAVGLTFAIRQPCQYDRESPPGFWLIDIGIESDSIARWDGHVLLD